MRRLLHGSSSPGSLFRIAKPSGIRAKSRPSTTRLPRARTGALAWRSSVAVARLPAGFAHGIDRAGLLRLDRSGQRLEFLEEGIARPRGQPLEQRRRYRQPDPLCQQQQAGQHIRLDRARNRLGLEDIPIDAAPDQCRGIQRPIGDRLAAVERAMAEPMQQLVRRARHQHGHCLQRGRARALPERLIGAGFAAHEERGVMQIDLALAPPIADAVMLRKGLADRGRPEPSLKRRIGRGQPAEPVGDLQRLGPLGARHQQIDIAQQPARCRSGRLRHPGTALQHQHPDTSLVQCRQQRPGAGQGDLRPRPDEAADALDARQIGRVRIEPGQALRHGGDQPDLWPGRRVEIAQLGPAPPGHRAPAHRRPRGRDQQQDLRLGRAVAPQRRVAHPWPRPSWRRRAIAARATWT